MSLDIDERQVLVYYLDDNVPYHHRVLLAKLEAGRWIWATPDFDVQVADLTDRERVRQLVPVLRNSPFPDGF